MTTNFDYVACSLDELADYVQHNTANRITQALTYYKKRNNSEMVEKIMEARRIVKKRKLQKILEEM